MTTATVKIENVPITIKKLTASGMYQVIFRLENGIEKGPICVTLREAKEVKGRLEAIRG